MIYRHGRIRRGNRRRITVLHRFYETITVKAALRAGSQFTIELMNGREKQLQRRAEAASQALEPLMPVRVEEKGPTPAIFPSSIFTEIEIDDRHGLLNGGPHGPF